jgi:glyoxylase-like metal-dependent hydrolase (beta-lactamase superfamily II)/dienelactone hydrolase
MRLITISLILASTALRAAVAQTTDRSVTLASVLEGRRVIEQVFTAVGGRAALRSVKTIELDEAIKSINRVQALRPGGSDSVFGHRMLWLDVAGQRFAELRTLDITGGQLWDNGQYITPRGGTFAFWSSMTKDSMPASALPSARAAFSRRYLLPLLINLERRVDPARSLGVATVNGKLNDVLNITDVDGGIVTLFVDRQTHLPTRMEQLVVAPAVGDSVDISSFSNYRKVGALTLPYRRLENRLPDAEWDYQVQRLELDKAMADSFFEAPAVLKPAGPPPSRMSTLAPDVYLVPNGHQSVFVVFDDFVLVLEGGGSSAQTRNTIARIREVAPGKPIRVVATHFHNDHIAGLRSFIAEGSTIITTPDARGPIQALAKARSVLAPDTLDRAPRDPIFEVVDKERVFKDARHEVRLYQIGPSPHADQILIAYLPKERLLFEADLLDVSGDQASAGGEDTEAFAAKLTSLGLAVDRFVSVHSGVVMPSVLESALQRSKVRAKCPSGKERRTPCVLAGFSVREIPTHAERNVAQPVNVLPVPAGPYRVGRMSFYAVDSTRREVMTPDPADVRELVFHVWYPSDATRGTRASYLDVSLEDSVFRRMVSFVDKLARVRSSALVDVPMSAGSRRYPVILFSHGLGVLSRNYTSFIENLASQGYIAVGVDHSYYSAPFPLPTGRSVMNLSTQQFRQRDVVAQAEDLSFVVNVLEFLDQASGSQATRIAGRLDLNALGVFGHSRGGFAAPHACRRDQRFKACVNLDGYAMTPAVMDSGITQPFMMVEEIAPWDPPAADSQLSANWTRAQADSQLTADSTRRERTFEHMTSDSYLVVSPGAVHNSFSDFGLITPERWPLVRQDFRRTIDITNAYLVGFFDTYLRARPSALLKGKSAKFPEVSLYVYKPGQAKRVFRGAPTWLR